MATTTRKRTAKPKAKGTAVKRRAGAPNALDRIVHTEGGTEITAGELVLRRLRAGAYREEAARSAGIAKATFYNWLYRGAQARRKQVARTRLTAEDHRYLTFVDQVEQAEAQAEARDWDLIGQLAQGGLPQQTIREELEVRRNPDGTPMLDENSQPLMVVVKRVRTVSQTLPSVRALTWRLEHRWPDRYGPVPTRELEPPEPEAEDLGARAGQLADGIEAYLQGVADGSAQPAE